MDLCSPSQSEPANSAANGTTEGDASPAVHQRLQAGDDAAGGIDPEPKATACHDFHTPDQSVPPPPACVYSKRGETQTQFTQTFTAGLFLITASFRGTV